MSSARGTNQQRRVFVVGVGMTKFERPGKRNWDYPDMAKEAGSKALKDSGVDYREVQQVVVGYVYGDSTAGQRAVYGLGLTGVPIYNVNNNCSTGSTALFMAKQFIEGGLADCVLALGFEKMERGSLSNKFNDRTNPLDQHVGVMMDARGFEAKVPVAPQMFGNAGREHMDKYGTTREQFAKIAYKNHKHSVNNPYSQFRDEYSLEQINKSPAVFDPLTKLQCCPTSEGSAAAVLCSEEFVIKHGLQSQAVEIIGMAMATDFPSTFEEKSCIKMVGFDMSKSAADKVYQQAHLKPTDVQVVELHDCFSANELITYEALGLAELGKGGQLIDQGQVTYGGKWVVNPSGGLISKGHPLGATGLAQCAELCWQLRGMAGPRQVPNCKVALQHNIGLGGAAVVAMYRLGFPDQFRPYPSNKWNPAIEAESIQPQATSGSTSSGSSSSASSSGSSLKSAAFFDTLSKQLQQNPSLAKSINAIYQFDIVDSQGKTHTWIADLKNGNGSITKGTGSTPGECVVTCADDDFIGMMTGKVNPQALFGKGKLKIKGNMSLAMKLNKLQAAAPQSKL